jgi:hypothetical protein
MKAWNRINLDDNLIRELYLSGISGTKIAQRLNTSWPNIYNRLKEMGIKRRTNSESHLGQPAWNKKGGSIDQMGYRVLWIKNRLIREHRVVAEKMLGRPLQKGEIVHHKNGIRSDNRPENLEILPSQSVHMKHHFTQEEAKRRGRLGAKKRWASISPQARRGV